MKDIFLIGNLGHNEYCSNQLLTNFLSEVALTSHLASQEKLSTVGEFGWMSHNDGNSQLAYYLFGTFQNELWMDVHDIVQETGIKTIPKKKKCKNAKLLSEEGLTNICEKKRSEKQRRKGKI